MTRKARKEYESRLARGIRTNKAFWNYVNSRRKKKTGIADLRNEEGIFVKENKDKPEVLSRQYFRIFTREDMATFPTFVNKEIQTELQSVLAKERVMTKLQSPRVDKSSGPDQIHPRVLQKSADILATPLFIMFRASLERGEVPKQWKVATMTPIYKKGDKANPANYRPVSLTSVIYKVFERILAEDITSHLRENNLLRSQQHSFISNLIEAMDIWTEALSNNLPVDIIFLDYAKVFDTVPHERLLAQLSTRHPGKYTLLDQKFLDRQRAAHDGQRCFYREGRGQQWGPTGFCLGPSPFYHVCL